MLISDYCSEFREMELPASCWSCPIFLVWYAHTVQHYEITHMRVDVHTVQF